MVENPINSQGHRTFFLNQSYLTNRTPLTKMPVRFARAYAAQDMALLRRLSVSLLKREPSEMSLAMKRYTAALDNNFFLKILVASTAD